MIKFFHTSRFYLMIIIVIVIIIFFFILIHLDAQICGALSQHVERELLNLQFWILSQRLPQHEEWSLDSV